MGTVLTDEANVGTIDHDQDLRRRIVGYLADRNRHSLRSLDVAVENGAVVIKGSVESFYEKQLCLNCCRRVAGVIRLIDEIKVTATMV